MTTLESVKNHSSPTRLPPSDKEPLRVSEAEYWKTYYEYPDRSYEWNNGLLEEKPMPDFLSISLYRWFSRLLEEYLTVFPIGQTMILGMGFRLELGKKKVSIRKPDLAVILHSNRVEAKPLERSFRGVCDLCIEFLSDSTPAEVERDTVHKKEEYAKAGVAEYYILDRLHHHTAFYFLNQQGVYETMEHQEPGVIPSRVLDRFAFRPEDLEKQVAFERLIEDPLYQPFLLKSFQQERQQKKYMSPLLSFTSYDHPLSPAFRPPSTLMNVPETKSEAGEARNTAAPARSSGSPIRPAGVSSMM